MILERRYQSCRKCGNTIGTYHCSSPVCLWCDRCGTRVRNKVYEMIVYGEWSDGE
jgi:hypothetical protein